MAFPPPEEKKPEPKKKKGKMPPTFKKGGKSGEKPASDLAGGPGDEDDFTEKTAFDRIS